MATWREFEDASPELARVGTERFRRHLLAWLATTRRDGRPRVHPVTPLVADDGRLYVFMEPTSPKGHDLLLHPAYALHCHVPDIIGTAHGEFQVSGDAHLIDGGEARESAIRSYVSTWSSPPPERYLVFGLDVAEAAGTAGGDDPSWMRWRAAG